MRAWISMFSRNLPGLFPLDTWEESFLSLQSCWIRNHKVHKLWGHSRNGLYFWNAKTCNCFTICGSYEYNVSPRCCRTYNILWLKVMFYWEIIMLPVVPFTVLQIFQTDFQTKDIKHSINSACQCVKWLEEEGKKLHYNICTILQQHFLPWELHSRQV